jgi:endonuclease III
MSVVREAEVKWSQDQMVEVVLGEPDDFLKVRETLTRIGVASRKEKKIYQSCHILHKQGRYYLVHFKELFALDGKHANLTPYTCVALSLGIVNSLLIIIGIK